MDTPRGPLHGPVGRGWTAGFDTPGQRRHHAYDATVPHSATSPEIDNYRALAAALGVASTSLPRFAPTRRAARRCRSPSPSSSSISGPAGYRSELREWPAGLAGANSSRRPSNGRSRSAHRRPRRRRAHREFIDACGGQSDRLASIAGRCGLAELIDILDRARCVVSVNTGVMHLAAAAGTWTIALNGPTNSSRWGPIGPRTVNIDSELHGCGFLNLGFEYDGRRTDCMGGITRRPRGKRDVELLSMRELLGDDAAPAARDGPRSGAGRARRPGAGQRSRRRRQGAHLRQRRQRRGRPALRRRARRAVRARARRAPRRSRSPPTPRRSPRSPTTTASSRCSPARSRRSAARATSRSDSAPAAPRRTSWPAIDAANAGGADHDRPLRPARVPPLRAGRCRDRRRSDADGRVQEGHLVDRALRSAGRSSAADLGSRTVLAAAGSVVTLDRARSRCAQRWTAAGPGGRLDERLLRRPPRRPPGEPRGRRRPRRRPRGRRQLRRRRERLKGEGRPLVPESRASRACWRRCDSVDHVLVFAEDTPEQVLAAAATRRPLQGRRLRALRTASRSRSGRLVEAYGGRVEFLPLLPGRSTTRARRAAVRRLMREARPAGGVPRSRRDADRGRRLSARSGDRSGSSTASAGCAAAPRRGRADPGRGQQPVGDRARDRHCRRRRRRFTSGSWRISRPTAFSFADVRYCPHGPEDGCECRKPSPKMLLDAAEPLSISPRRTRSWSATRRPTSKPADGQDAGRCC